jgi:hypothetical protein
MSIQNEIDRREAEEQTAQREAEQRLAEVIGQTPKNGIEENMAALPEDRAAAQIARTELQHQADLLQKLNQLNED